MLIILCHQTDICKLARLDMHALTHTCTHAITHTIYVPHTHVMLIIIDTKELRSQFFSGVCLRPQAESYKLFDICSLFQEIYMVDYKMSLSATHQNSCSTSIQSSSSKTFQSLCLATLQRSCSTTRQSLCLPSLQSPCSITIQIQSSGNLLKLMWQITWLTIHCYITKLVISVKMATSNYALKGNFLHHQ